MLVSYACHIWHKRDEYCIFLFPLLRTITTHQSCSSPWQTSSREISQPYNKPSFSTYHTWLYITTDSPLIIVYMSERILRQTKLTGCSDFDTKTLRHKHFSKSMPKVKNLRRYLHGTLVGSVSRMWDLNSQQGAKVRGQLPMLPNICNLTLLSLWIVNVQTKNNCPT